MITGVWMPDDLQLARIKVRLAIGGAEGERRQLLEGLRAAAGFLRSKVARSLGLRRAPELRFEYDEGPDASDRIEQVLAEIERERSGSK